MKLGALPTGFGMGGVLRRKPVVTCAISEVRWLIGLASPPDLFFSRSKPKTPAAVPTIKRNAPAPFLQSVSKLQRSPAPSLGDGHRRFPGGSSP
jgi:hypothetical protein